MTLAMEKAIAAISKLPAERQDALASWLLEQADSAPYRLGSQEEIILEQRQAAARADEMVEEKQVRALLARFRH